MCYEFTLLTQYDEARYVGICEHLTIHLAWDRITLYLRPDEFASLDVCLDEATIDHANNNLFLERFGQLDDLTPVCLLWVFETAVSLNASEFLVLADLVAQGVQKLPPDTPRQRHPQIHIETQPRSYTPLSQNYRLN